MSDIGHRARYRRTISGTCARYLGAITGHRLEAVSGTLVGAIPGTVLQGTCVGSVGLVMRGSGASLDRLLALGCLLWGWVKGRAGQRLVGTQWVGMQKGAVHPIRCDRHGATKTIDNNNNQ